MKTIQSMRMQRNLNILSYGIQLLIKEGHHNFFHLLGMYHRPKPYQVRTQDPLLPATGLAERESRAHSLLHRVPRNTSRTPSATVSLGLLIPFLTNTKNQSVSCLISPKTLHHRKTLHTSGSSRQQSITSKTLLFGSDAGKRQLTS